LKLSQYRNIEAIAMTSTIRGRGSQDPPQDVQYLLEGHGGVDPGREVPVILVPDTMAGAHKAAHDTKAWATAHVAGEHCNMATNA